MLNSFLEKTLFSQPVQPVLVEINLAKFSETLGQIASYFSRGLISRVPNILQDINPTFGFASLAPISPETIKWINSLPGVKMVHANLQVRALQEFVILNREKVRRANVNPPDLELQVAEKTSTIYSNRVGDGRIQIIDKIPAKRATEYPLRLEDLDTGEPTAPKQPVAVAAPKVPEVSVEPSRDWWPTSESRKELEAEKAIQKGITGENIRVGVADTGVDVNHPQLRGTEFYTAIRVPVPELLDENGHGSHVCSTIAGKTVTTPVNLTAEGVSRARLVSCKCLGRVIGTGFNSEIINAMTILYDKGCRIISMSLGSEEPQGSVEEDPICQMVKTLTEKGVIFVIAAGNSGPDPDTIGSPGASPYALTVAAIGKDGKAAEFSSRGGKKYPGKPDVAAPGVLIYSGTSYSSPMAIEQPRAGYGYVAISGTSMATPHVSGLIALLRQKYPDLTAEKVKDIMSRKGNTWNPDTGFGVPKWSYFN